MATKKTKNLVTNDTRSIEGMSSDPDAHSTLVSAIGDGDLPDVKENSDGSATITMPKDEARSAEDDDFSSNLAEDFIEESELQRIALDLVDHIERDKDARKERDKQYADGIKRTGMGNEAPGGAEFDGASKVVHPVLIEGCIDFSARAMKEIFPAQGPCRTQIIGEATRVKTDRAERKKQYMNWQLTTSIREYRPEKEQMLTQLPLGGSQYTKFWVEVMRDKARIHYEFVPVDDVLIPFAASDFYSAGRKTHVLKLTNAEYKSRVRSGLYRELSSDTPMLDLDITEAAKASDKVEGKKNDSLNEDGLRVIFEVYTTWKLKDVEDEAPRPYIISIDKSTNKVLSVYRNWEEDDEEFTELDWMVDHTFIPWRGAYGIGLPHIIGTLSGAMTGALRALLDSAHISNTPSGIKLKGGRMAGQTLTPDATEIVEVEAGPGVDDIRKMFMPFPFNSPSPVLVQLLEYMDAQAKGVVGTAEERIADATSEMPMGTTLALIEQGSITYSAIHARQHESQKRELKILHRLNAKYLRDEEVIEELGGLVVSRADFEGPMDIIPVSDPNIFSDTQRYAQVQAALGMAAQAPQEFKMPELYRRALQLLNYPNYEAILAGPAEPKKIDAVTENVEAAMKPETTLKTYPDQDHVEHIAIHLSFVTSPIFCSNPMMAMPAMPKILAHIKDHLIAYYAEHAQAAAHAATKANIKGSGETAPAAQAMHAVDQTAASELGQHIMPMLEKAQQMLQKLAPPPPQDPKLQSDMAKLDYQKQKDQSDAQAAAAAAQATNQFNMAKLQQDDRHHAEEMTIAAQNAQMSSKAAEEQGQLTLLQQQMKDKRSEEDNIRNNETALAMAQLKVQSDQTAQHVNFLVEQYKADRQEASDRRSEALAAAETEKNRTADAQVAQDAAETSTAHTAALAEQAHQHTLEQADHGVMAQVATGQLDKEHEVAQTESQRGFEAAKGAHDESVQADTADADHKRALEMEKTKAKLAPKPAAKKSPRKK